MPQRQEDGWVAVLAASARDLGAWARRRPVAASLGGLFLAANVAYASYRAAALTASDLRVGYLAPTQALLAGGKHLSDIAINVYPPFFYCVLAPFAALPLAVASVLWSLLQLLCFAVVLALAARLARRPGLPGAEVAVPALLATPLLLNNLHLGQSNLLPLALLAVGSHLAGARRGAAAGVPLAMAAAFKVTPALFLGHLGVLRLRGGLLASAAAALVGFSWLVPAAFFGPDRATDWLAWWGGAVAAPFVSEGTVANPSLDWRHTNQSLEAALQRHLTPLGRERYGGWHASLDPAWLDAPAAHRAANAARLLVFAGLVALALARRGHEALRFDLALVPLAALFISPVAWTSHYVAAAPAYLLAVDLRARLPTASRWRAALTAALALCMLLLVGMVSPLSESFSPVFLGHFLLWCVLLGFAVLGPRAESMEQG